MASKLNTLRKKRLNLVAALRENDSYEGITRFLTELYPDKAHFIYELLQNAEDPEASKVNFKLTNFKLEFTHNGKRLFELKDVDAITNIARSPKRDDSTSIGKFGVGFKAVFSYTNTPEIHSGDYHFRIHDLVVPETHGVPIFDMKDTDYATQFILPFDNPKKPAPTAANEIEMGLLDLGDNTLLFLNNIREIYYTLPNGGQGAIKRFDHEDGRIEINSLDPNGTETVSYWLHFQKEVEVIDDDGQSKQCNIAIAYSLIKDVNNKDLSTIWKIVPLDHGQVSIYFPAVKEASNLRFHLHAPFASPVARDSLLENCNGNNQLRDQIAELVVESLCSIRDQGLLTVNFLAVLPNPRDNLSKFYQPIQSDIINAFQNQALTPTKNKLHAESNKLYKGPARITNVIDDNDLVILTEYSDALWVANPPPQSQREEAFLDSLGIDTWSWEELRKNFGYYINDKATTIENWVQQKPIKWLISFYALLGELLTSNQYNNINIENLSIILVETDTVNSFVYPSKAYFPATEEITLPANTNIVNKLTYDSGRSDENKRLAKLFLEEIGIRPFDIKALIEHNLSKYNNQNKINNITKNYLSDIKMFVDYWRKTSDIALFKNHRFLYGRSKNGDIKFQLGHELYLDTPFVDTGLHNLFNDPSIKLEKYKLEILDKYQTIKGFADFAIELGVMSQLEIAKSTATKLQNTTFVSRGNRNTNTTIDDDYFINSLDGGWKSDSNYFIGTLSLSSKNLIISYAIWKTACKAKPEQLIACYLPNQKNHHLERTSNSQFIDQLKNSKWLPDRNSNFFTPAELTNETIHPDFIYDNSNGWLTAVGFGTGQRIRNALEMEQDRIAISENFSSHSQKVKFAALNKAGFDPDELFKKTQQIEFPEKRVPNPERRKKNVLELGGNAPSSESVTRERAIKPHKKGVTDLAKAYLRLSYTNAEDQLPCQCCCQEMPFRLGADNIHYFEAVQCISGLETHYKENALALCPTCAAMYKYACTTTDDEIEESILEYDNSDEHGLIIIPIILAGEKHSLHFVEAHWFDLKTILE